MSVDSVNVGCSDFENFGCGCGSATCNQLHRNQRCKKHFRANPLQCSMKNDARIEVMQPSVERSQNSFTRKSTVHLRPACNLATELFAARSKPLKESVTFATRCLALFAEYHSMYFSTRNLLLELEQQIHMTYQRKCYRDSISERR